MMEKKLTLREKKSNYHTRVGACPNVCGAVASVAGTKFFPEFDDPKSRSRGKATLIVAF